MTSVAMVWIYVITQIFAVGMVYLPLDSVVRVQLYNLAVDMSADATLLSVLIYVWGALPILWIIASVLYGIVYTVRRGVK